MENATKALLIAAAVLIVIVLVSVGLLLMKNVGNTAGQAQEVGDKISESAGVALDSVIGGTKGIIISKGKFNSFIKDFKKKYTSSNQFLNTILNEQNKILQDQIQVIGYVYQDDYMKLHTHERTDELKELLKNFSYENEEKNKEIFDYEINVWIPKLLQEGKIIPLKDALDDDERKEKLKEVYKNKKRCRTYRITV